MKTIALLTAVVLGVPAAAAYAQPARVQVEVRDRDWRHDRYDSYDQSHWNRDFKGRWVSLGNGYKAYNARQMISVDAGNRYSKLRIQGTSGAPVVTRITVQFANGGRQEVELNERLSGGAGSVIDLNGDTRKITRIIVHTDGRSRGEYAVYGA